MSNRHLRRATFKERKKIEAELARAMRDGKPRAELDANYMADIRAMLEAAQRWRAEHSDGVLLEFRPMQFPDPTTPKDAVIIGGLDVMIDAGAGANADTLELLKLLDAAATRGGGASVLMAEFVLREVFGLIKPFNDVHGESVRA